ncbi:MAG: tetratricopeptide repeat protein [Burkholderiales bacterium]
MSDLLQRGYRHQQAGDRASAERSYRDALEIDARNADAHYLLGALLGEAGNFIEAAAHLDSALAVKPGFADAHAARGNVCLMLEERAQARASYEQALRLDPSNATAHFNLGLLLQTAEIPELAFESFERAYALNPDIPDLLKNLTLSHIEAGRYDDARMLAERALAQSPRHLEALKCVGLVLQKIHRPHEALPHYLKAREIDDTDPELLNNFGIVMQDLGRLDDAIASYDAAIALRPDFTLALWHRSLAYLLRHDFARGWPDYELRLKSNARAQRPVEFAQWNGDDMAGKRVLIYGEQGLGDEIMFASCIPDLAAAGAHCIIECSPKLETLFRRSFPASTVYSASPGRALPANVQAAGIDQQSAIGSLPLSVRRTRADFPRHQGYLRADPELSLHWQRRLAALGHGLKVGIAWQGGTYKSRQPVRSLPLQQWQPILQTDNVHFVDLQYSDCSAEIAALRASTGIPLHSWEEVRADYEETAALVTALDLVISVCTAVIHLGGALGKPVWVIAPYSPEWRYGIAGEDMPWYPSVRVFRQQGYGEWDAVVEQVAQSLREKSGVAHARDTGIARMDPG